MEDRNWPKDRYIVAGIFLICVLTFLGNAGNCLQIDGKLVPG